jgi:hypothetical protein
VTLHVGLDTFRPITVGRPRAARAARRALRVTPGVAERIPGCDACAGGRHDDGPRAESPLARGAPLSGERLFSSHPASSSRRTIAADELPPARSTLARTRDGVRGVEETRRLYGSQSRSATASTPSATRWSFCETCG